MSAISSSSDVACGPEVIPEIRPGARTAERVVQNPAAVLRHQAGQLRLVDGVVTHGHFPWHGDDEPDAPEFSTQQEPEPEPTNVEVYGRSLRGIRAAGEAALKGAEVKVDPDIRRLRAEFDSAVGEMFKTAPGIGEHVTMERREQYTVQDGKVMADSNDSMKDVINRGIACSKEVAETSNPAMEIQVNRDSADLQLLLEEVEPMFRSDRPVDYNTVFAVSAFPEDGVAQYDQQFWKELGYNTEFRCAMLQMYHKAEDDQVVTRTLSIDHSNMARLVAMIEKHGGSVPANCAVSDLLTYPLMRDMSYDQACQFMDEFVADYERGAGLPPKLATTEQLVIQHANLRERTFTDLYLEVAKSSVANQKSGKMYDFITSIWPALDQMDAVHKKKLQDIAANETFDDEATRVMHGMVLYSVAETVRSTIARSLDKRLSSKKKPLTAAALNTLVNLRQDYRGFIEQMGHNFTEGIRQGMSYGGCGALFEFGKHMASQQAFGGGERKTDKEDGDAGDGLGPIEFKCTNNHLCRRPYGGKLKKCGRCNDNGESVGC